MLKHVVDLSTTFYTIDGKKTIHPLWGITSREFMQRLGQGLREAIAPDVWVKVLETQILREQEQYGLILIDDVRMPNEVEMVHRLGGIMIQGEDDRVSSKTKKAEKLKIPIITEQELQKLLTT